MMKHLRSLLEHLTVIENPFRTPEPYIVPARGDRALDVARLAQDFRPVYSGLTFAANAELARHVLAAH